jgi:glycosyltransferase involved in cell wall biosynthesis
MTGRFKALLAQRAPAEGYPPFLHQARILSSVANVTVLDTQDSTARPEIIDRDSINRVRVHRPDARPGFVNRLRLRLASSRAYRRALREQLAASPDLCIAFETEAIVAMLEAPSSNTLRVAHLHEHPSPADSPRFSVNRGATQKTLKILKHADLVSVPDRRRAELLVAEAHLSNEPIVVMNCPMLLETLPSSRLTPWLVERGWTSGGGIVHYQGGVGPDHCLETIIQSMVFWSVDAVLVIVGRGNPVYVEKLKAMAGSHGVGHRVFFVGGVNYQDVFQFAAGATVGVSILDPTRPNWRYSAGASNKRFEYIALGIPQVTNVGPGISELFEQTGVATTAQFDSAPSIARAINGYLDSERLRSETSVRARALHLNDYNYESQFAPMLTTIERALVARKQSARKDG